jgi:hypothetical protein
MEINMLYKVSGGPWGGDRINDAFIQLLRDVFGEDLVGQFKDFSKVLISSV